MNISITQGLDLNKLHEGIEKVRWSRSDSLWEVPMYIIMNKETLIAIAADEPDIPYYSSNGGYTYQGVRVAIDNGLHFGEVEIR